MESLKKGPQEFKAREVHAVYRRNTIYGWANLAEVPWMKVVCENPLRALPVLQESRLTDCL